MIFSISDNHVVDEIIKSKGHERGHFGHQSAQLLQLLVQAVRIAAPTSVGRPHLPHFETIVLPQRVDGGQAVLLPHLEHPRKLAVRERDHDSRAHLH